MCLPLLASTNMEIRTRTLLFVLICLSTVIIVLQLLLLRTQIPKSSEVIPTPTGAVVSPTISQEKMSWKQEGIPIVRGELAHYSTSDDCVYVTVDQPVKTKKILKDYVSDYSQSWQENYPKYPIQFQVSDYESITLVAMNAEEISNTFVKVNDSVYKITSNVGVPEGPPRCLQNYDQAITELLQELILDSNSTVTTQKVVYLKSAYANSNKRYIDADYIEWIEDPSAPNGYVVNNNSQQIHSLLVSPNVKITLLDWTDSGMYAPSINFEELTRVVKGSSANYNLGPNQPFDITLDKDNLVTSIRLRYTP